MFRDAFFAGGGRWNCPASSHSSHRQWRRPCLGRRSLPAVVGGSSPAVVGGTARRSHTRLLRGGGGHSGRLWLGCREAQTLDFHSQTLDASSLHFHSQILDACHPLPPEPTMMRSEAIHMDADPLPVNIVDEASDAAALGVAGYGEGCAASATVVVVCMRRLT